MRKFEFYSFGKEKLLGTVVETDEGLTAESAGDPDFKTSFESLVELEEAKTLNDVVKSGFSYYLIEEVTEDAVDTGGA